MKEEQGLVQLVQQGDLSAFRELVELHKKKMYYLAFDLTGSHHDAEDLSQEVFIKAYRGIHRFRGDAKFESWLYRIMVNTCISQKRKKSLASMHLDDELDQKEKDGCFDSDHFSMNPEQNTEAGLIQRNLEIALQKLAPRERSIFVLRHYHDLKLKEISEMLSINLGSVKSLLFRAIQKLQKELAFYKEDFGTEVSND